MSRKGRRGRSRKAPPRSARTAAVVLDVGPVTLPSGGVPLETPVASTEQPAEATAPARASVTPPPVEVADGEPATAEPSVPPVGDLDARFFAESTTEAWLAHELELRDPQFLRKMTAIVALRRARLARYVVGVMGVAAVLCLAALVKSAVPVGDDSRPHAAARATMPAAEPAALPPAVVAPAPASASPDEGDGGGN